MGCIPTKYKLSKYDLQFLIENTEFTKQQIKSWYSGFIVCTRNGFFFLEFHRLKNSTLRSIVHRVNYQNLNLLKSISSYSRKDMLQNFVNIYFEHLTLTILEKLISSNYIYSFLLRYFRILSIKENF
jgi:hypothetical protein